MLSIALINELPISTDPLLNSSDISAVVFPVAYFNEKLDNTLSFNPNLELMTGLLQWGGEIGMMELVGEIAPITD